MREDWEEIIYKDAVYKISTSKQKLKQKQYLKNGAIPIVDQGQDIIGGYTNDNSKILDCVLPVIVFGDHTKIIKLIDFQFAPGADGTKILEPSKFVLPKYLSFLTKILVFKIKDNGYARHYQHIEKELFPLAPLPIQRAIVSRIEALFSDLDNGIANFKKAQEQLKIYRQAVLKKAFEGKFTNSNVLDGKLPEGWEEIELGKVTVEAEKVKRKEKNQNEKFIYLDIGGIDNSINKIGNHKSYLWKNAPSRAQQIVKVGDTLFSTVRTYLKNIAFVEKEIYENQICSSGFSVIRAKEGKSIPKYLYYYSIYEEFIRPLNDLQKGSSYPAIRSEDVFAQFINLPPTIEEQHQIVQEIERRLSVCDKVEQSINESIEKAEALRQSILKKAFEGRLLSQAEIELCKKEADYEPASELLKKITSAKLSTSKAGKLAKEQALRQAQCNKKKKGSRNGK